MPVIRRLRTLMAAFLIAALPLQAAAVASMSCHGSQVNQAVATNPAIDHSVVANHEHRHSTQAGAHHEHRPHERLAKGAPDDVAGAGDHQNANTTSCAACASCAVFCMLSSAATGSYDCGIVAPGSMAPKAAIANGHADANLQRFLRPPR